MKRTYIAVKDGNIFEAFILGSLIYFGLSNIDISVTVNVTDKPILTEVNNAESVQNFNREIVKDD